MILLIALLAQLAVTKDVKPVWLDIPVSHWSCPAGWTSDGEICIKVAPVYEKLDGYNSTNQEKIHWGWVRQVPDSGRLRVEYPPEFVKQPGCEVLDKTEEGAGVRFSNSSKDGVTIHAKPGHKLHLNCRGIILRNP